MDLSSVRNKLILGLIREFPGTSIETIDNLVSTVVLNELNTDEEVTTLFLQLSVLMDSLVAEMALKREEKDSNDIFQNSSLSTLSSTNGSMATYKCEFRDVPTFVSTSSEGKKLAIATSGY